MSAQQILDIVEFMREIAEDNVLPKNVTQKLSAIMEILNDNSETSMKVSKAIHELEDIVDDKNLEAYSRTQLYNVISQLETV